MGSAQLNPGLYSSLDETRGSGHVSRRPAKPKSIADWQITLPYASLRLTTVTVRPGGRKKNDNQGSAGFVGNLDVPAFPVLLLSIETYVIPYCRDGVAVSGRKIVKHDPAIVGMNRKFCCNMEIIFALRQE